MLYSCTFEYTEIWKMKVCLIHPCFSLQYSVYPIIWAAGRGHAEIVRLLLQHGAKVNCSDKVTAIITPIWRCCWLHREEIQPYLHQHSVSYSLPYIPFPQDFSMIVTWMQRAGCSRWMLKSRVKLSFSVSSAMYSDKVHGEMKQDFSRIVVLHSTLKHRVATKCSHKAHAT